MYIAEEQVEILLNGPKDNQRITSLLKGGFTVGGPVKQTRKSTPPPPVDNYSGRKGAHLARATRTARPWNYVKQAEKDADSYAGEHMRMKPVIDQVRRLSAFSADPAGLYEFISAGFNLYCTPNDHPSGKHDFTQAKGQAKPISLVARVNWRFTDETITGLELRMARPFEYGWAMKKIRELFEMAEINLPEGTHINP